MTKPAKTTAERKPLEAAAYYVLAVTDLKPETRLPGDHAEYLPRIKLCIEALFRKREHWDAMKTRGECLIARSDTHEGDWRQRCLLTEVRMSLIGIKTTQQHRKIIRDAIIELGCTAEEELWVDVVNDIDWNKPFDLRKRVEHLRG